MNGLTSVRAANQCDFRWGRVPTSGGASPFAGATQL